MAKDSRPVNSDAAPGLAVAPLDRWLAAGAGLMLLAVGAAIARGAEQWPAIPLLIRCHLVATVAALALTPAILLGRKGDARHRALGYGWVAAMALAAGSSLGIRAFVPGSFSPIHLLSLYVLVGLPRLVLAARRGQIVRHRAMIRGIVSGGLLVAGAFTFPFHRLLGTWLLGG